MKKILFLLFTIIVFYTNSSSQCPQAYAQVLTTHHGEINEPGAYNSFGVRITLNQTYSEEVSVTGVIFDSENHSVSANFNIAVPAGYLTQDADDLLSSGRESFADVTINSVSPCPSPIGSLFQNIDASELQTLVNNNDSVGVEQIMYQIANQIADYVYANYEENIYDSIGDFPTATVMLGLLIYAKEENYAYIYDESSASINPSIGFAKETAILSLVNYSIGKYFKNAYLVDRWACFKSALGGLLGIRDLNAIFLEFQGGASVRTVIGALRVMGKRVLWGIAVGYAIWELGDCLDWW